MIETLTEVFGKPLQKWNGGDGKFHAMWNFGEVAVGSDGKASLTLFGLTEDQVLSVIADTVVHEEA